ncbi:outer membrane lipoprotein-sorting protein [Aromatoleum sp.]|uniref:outer membrane lipoprotein-sorting protein n=1 Tax=Aromatoleum sp. TaxID=2307007 RepID=UPI002FC95E3C
MDDNVRPRRCFISALAAGFLAPAIARAAESQPPAQGDEAARKLVAQADAIRFPRESFQSDITITNFSDGQAGDERKYRILSRGNEDTIVLTVEPASERGQALLMRGRDLWVFMPSVSQPVRLSLAQRLTGQVANGDLARANFSGDYRSVIVGADTLDGVATQVLDLAAVDRSVTYAKVKYWVAQKDARPIQAEFYALSGRLLKTCRYEEFRPLAGQTRPTRLVMEDALKKGDKSVLVYESMQLRELPERMFTREYLRRLD